MPSADPLAQLRDIHLPEPITWWPPAYGWWLLLALVCLALALSVGYCVGRYRANRYRRDAIAELDALFSNHSDSAELVAGTSALLKRAAIQASGEPCRPLHGESWLAFLLQHCPACSKSALAPIGAAQYQPLATIDSNALYKHARLWLRKHKGSAAQTGSQN